MAGKGAWLGAKTGFLLAICYTPLAVMLLSGTHIGPDIIGILIIGSVIGAFVGGIPAALLGSLVGALIGAQLAQLKERPDQRQAVLVGLGIAGGIGLLVNGLLADPASISYALTNGDRSYDYWFAPLQSYVVFLAVPSLICIGAGGWMGQRLAAKWWGSLGSQSFAHLVPTNRLDPAAFIRQQHQSTHRYEIDLTLLGQGYSAEQIEEEWRKLGQRSRRKLRLGQFWQLAYSHWLVITLVGSGVLAVILRLTTTVPYVSHYCCD